MKNMTKTITIVATSHNESKWNRAFIQSMQMQTALYKHNELQNNWTAIIYNNGLCDDGELKHYCYGLKNIIYIESSVDTGNWGTANRQDIINKCQTDYILQTSIQDYFLPDAINYILRGLETEPDILLWNSINHLVGPCKVLDAKLEWSKLDWGNFAIKTSIAKQVGINHGNTYCADWNFINDCLTAKLIKTAKKLDYILTCHN